MNTLDRICFCSIHFSSVKNTEDAKNQAKTKRRAKKMHRIAPSIKIEQKK